jgi:hypothetical protein
MGLGTEYRQRAKPFLQSLELGLPRGDIHDEGTYTVVIPIYKYFVRLGIIIPPVSSSNFNDDIIVVLLFTIPSWKWVTGGNPRDTIKYEPL